MKLTVLREMEYKNSIIYVMQYGTMFQYLFAWRGRKGNKIYQHHVFLKPTLWGRIKSWFGYPMYSQEYLEYGEQVLLSGATRSIDELRQQILPKKKIPINQ